MPFMHGPVPLRRTFYHLKQGKIFFRDNVRVFTVGFHRRPTPLQVGARDFVFWHWAQIQYHNPTIQLVKLPEITVTPFAKAFLNDGREVLFDLEGLDREQILSNVVETLGKTPRVLERERLESIATINPASFGSNFERQCMCELQGQHPCTSLLLAPNYLKGKWRWNHKLL